MGGQAVDLVMIVMNDDGMHHLLSSKFKIGADASAAAGPVGRHAGADTDWKMKSEVLSHNFLLDEPLIEFGFVTDHLIRWIGL